MNLENENRGQGKRANSYKIGFALLMSSGIIQIKETVLLEP